jgi:ubiquinone/menaquinone biosynthesis C-methylase UbiE
MRLTEYAHLKLKQVLRPGDLAIDATAGNGHDTLALAELVGTSGKVYAIDLQAAAIAATRKRLEAADRCAQCELVQGDHAEVLSDLLGHYHASAAGITFNLGYLPGSDKAVTTRPETTLRALDAAMRFVRPGGILLVTAYRGHRGGEEEAGEIEAWMWALPETNWQVEAKEPPTRDPKQVPPILWVARKKGRPAGHPFLINKRITN